MLLRTSPNPPPNGFGPMSICLSIFLKPLWLFKEHGTLTCSIRHLFNLNFPVCVLVSCLLVLHNQYICIDAKQVDRLSVVFNRLHRTKGQIKLPHADLQGTAQNCSDRLELLRDARQNRLPLEEAYKLRPVVVQLHGGGFYFTALNDSSGQRVTQQCSLSCSRAALLRHACLSRSDLVRLLFIELIGAGRKVPPKPRNLPDTPSYYQRTWLARNGHSEVWV